MATGCDEEMPESKFPPSQLFPAHQKALHAKRGRDSDGQDSTDLEPAIKQSLCSSVTCIKQEPVTEYETERIPQPVTEYETERIPQPVIPPIGVVERELHKTLVPDAVCPETGTDNGAGTHIESQPTTELETDAVINAEPITEQASSACGSMGHLPAMEDLDTSKWVNLLSHISSSMIHLLTTLLEGEHTKFELINKLQSDMLILYRHFSSHYGFGSSYYSQSQAEHSDDDWESLELERRPVVQLEPIIERLTCVNSRLFTLADAVVSSCSQVHKELETLAICPEPDTGSVRGGCQPTTGLETDPVISAEPITEQSTSAYGFTEHLSAMELAGSVRLAASISRFSSPVKSLFVKVLKKHREIASKLTEMLELNTEFLSRVYDYEDSWSAARDGSDADDESVDFRAGSSLSDTEEE